MREATVQVSNELAHSFDEAASELFDLVQWEAETGDFWTTFEVWSAFTNESSEEQVDRFVGFAETFEG